MKDWTKFQKKMFEEKCVYHSECYKEITNITELRRLSVRICELETTEEKKVQIIETNEQNQKFQLYAQGQSPVFIEKGYV